jgi:solute carrier family 25 carnitine/acylcarnitine transporter 20/29
MPHAAVKMAYPVPHVDAASLPPATGFLPLWLADGLAGATGGALECVSGHPLDTIKVAKQTGQSQESVLGTARAILNRDGWRGFYKGVKAPLTGLVAINSVMFTTYASTMAAFRRWDKDGAPPTLWHHFWAGCASGAVTAFVECPLDLMKCQMQTRGVENQSFFGTARHVFRLNGVAGFSQGLTATLLRNVPGQGSHFVVYAATLQYGFGHVDGDDHQAAPWQCLAAGSLAGIALWASTYPADVVKTMIQ